MSTLESYFKGEKDLFTNLDISRLEKEWLAYPVFRFDLSQENFINTDRLIWLISRHLSKIEKSYGLKSDAPTIGLRFSDLIEQAYEKYEKPLTSHHGKQAFQPVAHMKIYGYVNQSLTTLNPK